MALLSRDAPGLVERFLEANDARRKEHGTERGERQHVGPQHSETDLFQDGRTNDDKIIAQWIHIGEPLQHNWHAGDGKAEP